MIPEALTPEEACAIFCRRVESCRKCSRCGKCVRPSRIGMFAFTANAICLKSLSYLPHSEKYKAEVRIYPAVLEDNASIVLKISVRIPHIHAKRMIYLHGYESAYHILKTIIRAWREMVLNESTDTQIGGNNHVD